MGVQLGFLTKDTYDFKLRMKIRLRKIINSLFEGGFCILPNQLIINTLNVTE